MKMNRTKMNEAGIAILYLIFHYYYYWTGKLEEKTKKIWKTQNAHEVKYCPCMSAAISQAISAWASATASAEIIRVDYIWNDLAPLILASGTFWNDAGFPYNVLRSSATANYYYHYFCFASFIFIFNLTYNYIVKIQPVRPRPRTQRLHCKNAK